VTSAVLRAAEFFEGNHLEFVDSSEGIGDGFDTNHPHDLSEVFEKGGDFFEVDFFITGGVEGFYPGCFFTHVEDVQLGNEGYSSFFVDISQHQSRVDIILIVLGKVTTIFDVLSLPRLHPSL
jgi:hypothetical protein